MGSAIQSDVCVLTDEELDRATGGDAIRIGPISMKAEEGVLAFGIAGVLEVAVDLGQGGSWGRFLGWSWNF